MPVLAGKQAADCESAETWNAVTLNDPCPGGPGLGPFLGLCANNAGTLGFLIIQVTSSMNPGNPFHFSAFATTTTWGPFGGFNPGLTIEAVCFYLDTTTGSLVSGPVSNLTIQ